MLEGAEDEAAKVFTSEIAELMKELSSGASLDADSCTLRKVLALSVFLGNVELFAQSLAGLRCEGGSSDVSAILFALELFGAEALSSVGCDWSWSNMVRGISSRFFELDAEVLRRLPIEMLDGIISDGSLCVESEDSLLDFIESVRRDDSTGEARVLYENVDLSALSSDRFKCFVENLEQEEVTANLWRKLKKCMRQESQGLCLHKIHRNVSEDSAGEKSGQTRVEYDERGTTRFKGILWHLGGGNSKNVIDNKTVDITSSTHLNNSCHEGFNAVEYEGKSSDNYFHSEVEDRDAWLCIDFKERKVNPSHYSLKSYAGKNWFNIQNWNVEGSNDGKSWSILDERRNERSLDDRNAENTFEVKKSSNFYRYIRIRQTGPNTYPGTDYRLIIRSIEFFGTIQEP